MVDAHKESNVCRSGSDFESVAMGPNVEAVKVNGVAFDIEAGSTGLEGDGLLTYKRRRIAKVAEGRKISDDSSIHLDDQTKCSPKGSHDPTIPIDDCSLKHQRNIILEQICQSLNSEGGLKKCIQNALVFHPRNGSKMIFKESVHSCEVWSKCTSWTGTLHAGLQTAAKSNVGMISSESVNETNPDTFMELRNYTFFDIIMSEKFGQLCSLLLENLQGMKAAKLFDLNYINSRMKERAYESSPLLFQLDIQEIWMKLQKFGTDIAALAKCLSEETTVSFREQVANPAHGISQDGKHEFLTQESGIQAKPERTEGPAPDEAHTCRRCREKADGRNSLVCDSCEEMYHISCIEPAFKEIPSRSWYCANCTAKETESSHENSEAPAPDEAHTCRRCREKADGRNSLVCDSCEEMYHISSIEPAFKEIPSRSWYCANCTAKETESSHENCIACERLYASKSPFDGNGEDGFVYHETTEALEESSNDLVRNEGGKRFPHCKFCRAEVRNGEEYRICGHSYCLHKFYHVKCLITKQLVSYGPCWYCPSCLCRTCFTDRDDDKIVLCDGCDHAYHTYCMQLPRSSIPKGKWFCQKCHGEIQRIRKGRRSYENISKKRALDRKLKGKESGGVDMLQNAAKTLKYEENLAAMGGRL